MKTNVNSELNVTQTVTLGGTLSVSGTATFNDQFAIVATDNTVSVVATGVSITASTTITGAVCIYGDTKVEGTVTITGNTSITGTVTITGDLKADSLQLAHPSDRLTHVLTKEQAFHFANVAGNTVATQNVSVVGVVLSDFNLVLLDTPDIIDDSFIADAVVIADDTVGLKLHNTSNSTLTAITATYRFAVFQFS